MAGLFAAIAYGAKTWLKKTHEEGVRSISRSARELGKQYVMIHKTETYIPSLNTDKNLNLNGSDPSIEIGERIQHYNSQSLED
jgi:hypothetical protein